MKYKLLFLDTETTGNEEKDRLIQIAYKYKGQTKAEAVIELFKAPIPMSIESMEVTHITNNMIKNSPSFVGSQTYTDLETKLADPDTIFIAHNAPFDVGMLEKEGLKVDKTIDTLRIARHLDDEAKLGAYRLQYLRYALDLDKDINEEVTAHDAYGDIVVLEKLFDRLFAKIRKEKNSDDETVDEMIRISSEPVLIKKFTFGKHVGKLIEDVAKEDKGYLEWLYKQKKQSESDETDWLFTLERFLR
jgi:DNA polymerase III epsilon subunit-like protein